MINKLKLKIYH